MCNSINNLHNEYSEVHSGFQVFSIMKHIKSTRRTSLAERTLEDLLRVSLHGPRDMKLFDSSQLAKKWKGVAPKDTRAKPGPKRKSTTEAEGPEPKRIIFTADGQEQVQQQMDDVEAEVDLQELEILQEIDNGDVFAVDDENTYEPVPVGEPAIF